LEFDMDKLDIGMNELKKLMEWLETIDPKPHVIYLSTEQTGIGKATRAEIKTAEDEGRWKDLTDYSNW
jgi:hypothetical protein